MEFSMPLKSLLAATAMTSIIALSGAVPSHAQVAPQMGGREPLDQKEGIQTPETLGAGRSMAGPEGTEHAKPADPHVQPQGARQPASGKEGDTAATSVRPPPGSSAQAGGQPGGSNTAGKPDTERAPPVNTTDAQSPNKSRAGGALAGNQVMVEDLAEMSVNLSDKEDFGKVAGTVLNLQTGQVEKLLISTGGFLGVVGDAIYEVPWNKVAEINKGGKEIRINAKEAEIQPQREDRADQDN
jgi:sporulation protein YlmC with PRC-barrel domain